MPKAIIFTNNCYQRRGHSHQRSALLSLHIHRKIISNLSYMFFMMERPKGLFNLRSHSNHAALALYGTT